MNWKVLKKLKRIPRSINKRKERLQLILELIAQHMSVLIIVTGFVVCYKTYNEAINSTRASGWEQAMKEELKSLKENDTFELTNLP